VTPPSGVAATLISALLIFGWYRIDSSQRGYRRSPWLNVGVVLLALVALPVYFFRSRGAKGGLTATAIFLAGIIGYSVLGLAGQYIASGLQS
jgi:formate hydrogenlyase subunit 4